MELGFIVKPGKRLPLHNKAMELHQNSNPHVRAMSAESQTNIMFSLDGGRLPTSNCALGNPKMAN
jgi:hypothetical protein